MSDTFQDPMGVVGDAASTAFQNALNEGLPPEQAFEAAETAGMAAGQEAGIPAGAMEAAMSSAQEAFTSAIAGGDDPSAAFEAAGDAVQGAMADGPGEGGPIGGPGDGGPFGDVADSNSLSDGAGDALTSALDGAEVQGGTPTGPIAPDEPAVQDEQVFEDTAQDDEPGDQNDFG